MNIQQAVILAPKRKLESRSYFEYKVQLSSYRSESKIYLQRGKSFMQNSIDNRMLVLNKEKKIIIFVLRNLDLLNESWMRHILILFGVRIGFLRSFGVK